jgi:hypothetical protein
MNKFERILLVVFFIELFVGGGGRRIDFGIVSIRQILFILLILTFVFRLIKDKALLDKDKNTFLRLNPVSAGIYLLLGWFVVSAVIGLVNGHTVSVIITDLFRVSFFAAYFPLAYYLNENRFTKERVISLMKYSALVVASVTLVIVLLGKTVYAANFEPFQAFWKYLLEDDILFRKSHAVFYKSQFYVLIVLVLSLNAVLSKKYQKIDIFTIIFGSLSLLLSDTRGFSLALMIGVLLIVMIDIKVITDPIKGWAGKAKTVVNKPQLIKKTIILLLITISVPFLYQYMTMARFGGEQPGAAGAEKVKDTSVSVRIDFMVESKDILLDNPVSFLFGKGYGTEIAGRDTGLEMSFLDIWVEQGAIGLGIWFYLFFLVYFNYYRGYREGVDLITIDRSLMGAFLGVLLLTNINPFINNPIGIGFFLIILIFSQNFRWSQINGEIKHES